jgi:hypothetical protein
VGVEEHRAESGSMERDMGQELAAAVVETG